MSGGQRVISIYADHLRRRGHEVMVVSPPRRARTTREKLRSVTRGGGWPKQPREHSSHFDGLGLDCRVLDKYRPILHSDVPDADVVIATWWETAEWASGFPAPKGAKVYFIQHHEVFPYLPVERVEATWKIPFHKILISQWLATISKERYGDASYSLVPNSVDLNQFWAARRRKNTTPTIGLMYSSVHFKGCDISLAALGLVRERFPSLRIVSFGQSAPVPNLPLLERTHYVVNPQQASIREIYSQCDAWLVGSRSEGFGLPILEAMACRTPVISTPCGAAPELLASGGGIIVAPEDPCDMAKAIEKIVCMSEGTWGEMSDLALATASLYTWENATDLFEAALLTAIKKSDQTAQSK